MPSSLTQSLLKATGLTRMGRLMDATRLIQRALGGSAMPSARPAPKTTAQTTAKTVPDTIILPPPLSVPQPAANDDVMRRPAHPNFSEQSFAFEGKTYPYRLFVPKRADAGEEGAKRESMPLVVLLHGCKQDALDFSKGTAMNALAGKEQCLVLYPEQITRANLQMCWNWFEPGHQQEGTGEPGMIAALTRQVLDTDFNGRRADPKRVYIAGLSAGGAMAAVVAGLHPELFTALGVHSGLPAGAASNVMTAFQAMRIGAQGQGNSNGGLAIPTIVFHGEGDTTVHPSNGENIAADALAAIDKADKPLIKSQSATYPDGNHANRNDKPTEVTRYSNAADKSFVEYWSVEGGPHAWSGGSKEGSYTDPEGPPASKAMLDFFLQHRK